MGKSKLQLKMAVTLASNKFFVFRLELISNKQDKISY